MKHKTLLAFAFLFFSCYALNAQIDKGSILLGGTLGYNNNSNTGYNTNANANISPRISYAIGKNSVIGVAAYFGYSTGKFVDPYYKITNTTYGGSFFWRQYLPIQNKLGWYTELNAGIEGTKGKSITAVEYTSRTTTYRIGAVPGVYFQALPKLVLNANVGGITFSRSISKNSSNNAEGRASNLNVNFLSNFTFGIDFILGKKSAS